MVAENKPRPPLAWRGNIRVLGKIRALEKGADGLMFLGGVEKQPGIGSLVTLFVVMQITGRIRWGGKILSSVCQSAAGLNLNGKTPARAEVSRAHASHLRRAPRARQ